MTAPHATTPTLSPAVLLLMAVACGLCAGANYFNQPLLHSIAIGLEISDADASLTVTLAQLAYGAGLLLFVPLGDLLERRRLVVSLMVLASAGLIISASAQSLAQLTAGIIMTGLFSVAAQVLVPMAATLVPPAQSGRAVGLLMSGLLVGILISRTVAGVLSEVGGWTTVYWVGGATLLLCALVLARVLPASRNQHAEGGYLHQLRSLGRLLYLQPRLRTRGLMGGLMFGSLSVLFSTMALMLAGDPHRMDDATIGLIGLAGVAGALMASAAGRLADRGWGRHTTWAAVVIGIASWALLAWGGQSLVGFLIGLLMIDLALQGVHINNQMVIYALQPDARARLNACYMTLYFAGAAAGSALGAAAWQYGGWHAACGVGVVLAAASMLALLRDEVWARRALLTA